MELKLLESEQPEPKKTLSQLRQYLVLSYYEKYSREYDCKCPETFVKCLGALKSIFEGFDDDSGEIIICYPTEEDWNSELDKFFYRSKENWYRINNRITFYTFCKNYGRYNHHIPRQPEKPQYNVKPQMKQTRIKIACNSCGKNHYSDENCLPDTPEQIQQ